MKKKALTQARIVEMLEEVGDPNKTAADLIQSMFDHFVSLDGDEDDFDAVANATVCAMRTFIKSGKGKVTATMTGAEISQTEGHGDEMEQ
ncbi:hypothetical protein [Nitrospira sp. BLG_1]|uniref:hypothetical protein n=1 Tax=Nitrospira sp. BLG_1 TaxID=3395883 RepID=UPI0039BD8C43